MLTALVLFLFIPATLVEWLTVLKHSRKKAKIIHISLMLVSFVVLMLYSFNIAVPTPTDGIQQVLDAIFHLEG